jgi:regulator of nucleoside diphosphate kinase
LFLLEIDMAIANDLLISSRDAEVLSSVVESRHRAGSFEADATNALVDILMDAPLVPHERLPADRVAMNSRVTYREEPGGVRRTVVLVHPSEAMPAKGHISVLSPVGRSLLGRRSGSSTSIGVPGGRALTIRVLLTEKGAPTHSREVA